MDALRCLCGGRLEFVAVITERETALAVLQSMGVDPESPATPRARDPMGRAASIVGGWS